MSSIDLTGRRALVTGGGKGIGRAIADVLADEGCDLVLVGREQAALDAAATDIRSRCQVNVETISADLSEEATVKKVASQAGAIDILVNNAGAAWGADYAEFPEAGWDKVMDLNVKTPFFLTQKLHTLLTAAASADKPGKVINITSIDGQRVNPWETYSYQASKAALIHLTRRMAARLVSDHIYVTSLAPGAFPSNMNKVARDMEEQSAKGIPSKRVGDKFDMGGTAVYLASRAGDYTIGETLTVDGGIVNAHLPTHFADPSGGR